MTRTAPLAHVLVGRVGRVVVVVVVVAAVVGTIGCESAASDPEGPACTDEVADSVQVTVDDDAGEPVTDAVVTFRANDGIAQRCATEGDGLYFCGVELFGDFVISVTRTGFVGQTAAVTVERDAEGCHVVTETLAITLAPVAPDT